MGTGDSLVSFVFGLEVTWDLLSVQLEQEAEGDLLVEGTPTAGSMNTPE